MSVEWRVLCFIGAWCVTFASGWLFWHIIQKLKKQEEASHAK